MAHRLSQGLRQPGAQRGFSRVQVALFPQQVSHAQQHLGGDGVAGRHGVVAEYATAMDERLVVIGGEVKTAARVIGEAGQHDLQQLAGKTQFIGAEAQRLQREDRIHQQHVVVQVGRQLRGAVSANGQQPAAAPQLRAEVIQRTPGCRGEVVPA